MHRVRAVPTRYNPFVNGEKPQKTQSSIKPVRTQKNRWVGLFFKKNPGFLKTLLPNIVPMSLHVCEASHRL